MIKASIRFISAILLLNLAPLASADTVLTFAPKGEQFEEIIEGMKGDLEDEVEFVAVSVAKSTKVKELKHSISMLKPRVIVLIGNASVNLYIKYQKENPNTDFPPSIAIAALYLDKFIGNIKYATGIRYEIPLVTSAVNIRSLISSEVKRIGVIHRKFMHDFVETNKRFAKAEGFELVSVEVPNKDNDRAANLKKELQKISAKNLDALWIVNDNALLNGQLLAKSWLPALKNNKIPTLVGIKPLLSSKLGLGSFAIVPDHYGLGVQTSSLIFDLMDNDWELEEAKLEQPLSVKKLVNQTSLDSKKVSYRKDKLSVFDEVLN